MFTAADLRKELQVKRDIPELDEWIKSDLKNLFIQYGRNQVTIQYSSISRKEWNHTAFLNGLTARGFGVSRTSDQREGDFYTITIPVENN
jgi:hypothetical protein